jgi:thimet oligopeptidase
MTKMQLLMLLPTLVTGLTALAATVAATETAPDSTHAWTNKMDAAALERWAKAHIESEQKQIADLLAVKGPRTVENTLVPFDRASADLTIAGNQSFLMNALHPDKAVRDKAEAMTQAVQQAATALALNHDVYQALSAVDVSKADSETQYLMERTLLQYRLAGVDKDEATRNRVRELQDKQTSLSLHFARNIQEHVNTVQVKDVSELAGLPDDYIARVSKNKAADGTITLTTDQPDYGPVMTFAKSDDLRHRMFLAYATRAYPANKQVLTELLQVRQEIASTLGYKTWADLSIADKMMGSVGRLNVFLQELDEASKAGAEKEYAMVLANAQKQQPGLKTIDMAGSSYWGEQFRRAAFDFDSQSVRPYFPYERVQQGVLDTAAKLFHVEFKQAHGVETWDPSVTVWDVIDNGKRVGRFYLDMHPREGKDKWFSESGVVPGILGVQMPEAALICNFSGGNPDDPGLMQYREVVTFFHEFGHLMHEILGGQHRYASQSGVATEWDFVEAPSQMLEEIFRDPAILQSFAKHYQTNEPIPADMVARMNRASAFGRAGGTRGGLFYTRYALDLHDRSPKDVDLDVLLKQDTERFIPYQPIEGDRMYASFTHLTGYSSNYYTYAFDKVIALDFFSQFDHKNLLGGETAMRYRKAVLEPGGSKPAQQLVEDFLGREQNLKAFEAWMNEEFAATR